MTRYLAVALMLLTSTLFTMGCGGGGGDGSSGDNTGQDTTGTPDKPAAEEPTGDLSGAPSGSTASDGPSLDITIPGDDASTAENGGSDSEAKKSVSEAIFNSILRGATGGAGE